ncbi:MAG: hypothetical protein AAF919_16660 [Pseudomonadota bacterium]
MLFISSQSVYGDDHSSTIDNNEVDVLVGDDAFFSVTARVALNPIMPDTFDGKESKQTFLEFLLSRDGEIADLKAFQNSDGVRRSLCDPIPIEIGDPPETIYLIPIGCPGTGGGGGNLKTLEDMLVVEFDTDSIDQSVRDGTLRVQVQEITNGSTRALSSFSLGLPGR